VRVVCLGSVCQFQERGGEGEKGREKADGINICWPRKQREEGAIVTPPLVLTLGGVKGGKGSNEKQGARGFKIGSGKRDIPKRISPGPDNP